MKYTIKIRLRDWKNNNTKTNWDFIISSIPPAYKGGYNHEYISSKLFKGGTLKIVFGNKEVTDKFLLKVMDRSNIFDVEVEK